MRHIHAYSIMENGKLNEEKLEKMIGGQNYGFIEGITLPGKECLTLMNEVQNICARRPGWVSLYSR